MGWRRKGLMNWQRIAWAAALGAVLLLGVADAGARTERVRPYETAGPAGLGSDEPLCRRLAATLNAEGRRDLMALCEEAIVLHIKGDR